ncbi:Protein export cytoplasm protein SecA ATPase RNA helicase [Candidatus Rhodobacter oscarellae]|uniref:Protein export cytoplasm protein SecA ATPase RNA helicase n=1 Tax=Candidatus Rhodobacter oscarellae TaxID=1675527 RepID=A0A0J9ECS1_9RHOB|nr:GNAT family N-acetyltransferase [Candidatus Rhodobacter lobularis]KMW60525.1 Protein export cytoplasm protein SecA ATPase RNA helicase [Candidatus Rhodobacter lobularis]
MIQTDRLTLRRPVEADRAPYVAFYTSDRRARTGLRQDAGAASAGFDAVMSHWQSKSHGRFIVETGGHVIGLVGPHQPEGYPEPELAWHIWSDAHEGKGLAFEAAQASRDYAFGTLGWATAVSYIADDNPRSLALARRLGAVRDPGAALLNLPAPHGAFRHPNPGASQ